MFFFYEREVFVRLNGGHRKKENRNDVPNNDDDDVDDVTHNTDLV